VHRSSRAKIKSKQPLSVADVILLVKSDETFPPSRRATTLSSLAQLAKWKAAMDRFRSPEARMMSKVKPEEIPFTLRTLNALFERIVPRVLGRSRKRIQNAYADCRFVLERYGLAAERLRVGLTPQMAALAEKLDRFERIAVGKLFAYLSLHKVDPPHVNDAVAEGFRVWLRQHEFKNPDTIWRRAVSTWNHAVHKRYPGWPQTILTIPSRRVIWGLPWSSFPASLQIEVDQFFAQRMERKP
jgi:hypothetical protein